MVLIHSLHTWSRYIVLILQNLSPESFSRAFLNSSIRAAGWQRRDFRNRGPVRKSCSERRSRCGAACTASVRVWCRAHFCHFRVAGCGDRACLRHAAGVPRRRVVGIGVGACCVHAWRTRVSHGRLRGSGVPRACRGHAAAPCPRRRVVGIGVGACCVHA